MHTHTFQSRFKVGDKITDGRGIFTIAGVGCDVEGCTYYQLHNELKDIYYESILTAYHLAPKYPLGSRVWFIGNNEIREAFVTNKINNIYVLEGGSYTRLENQIFPTAEDVRNSLKVFPLP